MLVALCIIIDQTLTNSQPLQAYTVCELHIQAPVGIDMEVVEGTGGGGRGGYGGGGYGFRSHGSRSRSYGGSDYDSHPSSSRSSIWSRMGSLGSGNSYHGGSRRSSRSEGRPLRYGEPDFNFNPRRWA